MCDILCFWLSGIEEQSSTQGPLSKHTAEAPICLSDACILNAWDDKMGAADDVCFKRAPKTVILEANLDCFLWNSVPVLDDVVTSTIGPLFCHFGLWFWILLLTWSNRALGWFLSCISRMNTAWNAKSWKLADYMDDQYLRMLCLLDLLRPVIYTSI